MATNNGTAASLIVSGVRYIEFNPHDPVRERYEADLRRRDDAIDALAGQVAALTQGRTTAAKPASSVPYNPQAGGGLGGGGTVSTNVTLSAPSTLLSVNGTLGAITSNTFVLDLVTQVSNTVFAGPATGADAAPTFRALTTDDLPPITIAPPTFGLPAADTDYTLLVTDSGVWSYPDTIPTSAYLPKASTCYAGQRMNIRNASVSSIQNATARLGDAGDTLYNLTVNATIAGVAVVPGQSLDFQTDGILTWAIV